MIQRLREEKLELSFRSVESTGHGKNKEKKGGGALRMRRNFVKGDGERLFCFGTDSVE